MLEAFSALKSLVKPKHRFAETLVFYLHYRITFLVLLFCCILISTQQFVGNKINCLSKPSGEINAELLNSYCWAASTYSVNPSYLKEVGIHSPHPGIAGSEEESEYEYRNFYQYVHIVLFIQAILFYFPHLMWKNVEEDLTSGISSAIHQAGSNNEEDVSPHIKGVAIYMEERWGNHKSLALMYLFCEILAAVNVMVQSYLLDVFFHGKFLGLGLLMDIYYGSRSLSDPTRLFPLVTICHFRRYGASGYIDVIDALCVLPINALNAKIFLFLWIWFILLMILSLLSITDLFICIIAPSYRVLFLKVKSLLFHSSPGYDSYVNLVTLGNFGDWFVLSSIKRNKEELDFRRLTEFLQSKLISNETETKESGP